jgi:putative restriction endonuclease
VRWDVLAGAILRDDPARFSRTYRLLLSAARAEGIGPGRLPDFLGIEHGGELALLGQEELDISALEAELREQIARRPAASRWAEPETERILLAAARVGQHVFAQQVLANCGSRCVFRGGEEVGLRSCQRMTGNPCGTAQCHLRPLCPGDISVTNDLQ